jgi:outer membrane lipoprotein-sorting protein
VPAGALAITGGVIAAVMMPSAQASPSLPAKTPAQLLADVAAQTHVPAFTGSVLETTSLGLPQLPGSSNQTSMISLLTGSHTVNVWFANPHSYRLSLPAKMSESDLYRDGQTAWLWQSVPDTATKFVLGSSDISGQAPMPPATPSGGLLPVTPQQAAAEVLAAVGPTTTVSVASNVYVAGKASYELVLAPKDARSLIGQVRIAVDAANGLPLRVEVVARHASSPAITIGFTSITFGAPSPSDLTFTPPKGAKVSTTDLSHGGGNGGPSDGVDAIGSGWLCVLKLPASALTDAAGASPGNENPVNGGDDAAALQAVLGSATTVQGAFGSGQLIKTSLVNVLITGGSMYVGAVEPSVLYAAAGGPGQSNAAAAKH